MRQQKIVASRFLVSSKFAPVITKSIQERAEEFTETRTLLSLYPFSANYAVKAAMGGRKNSGKTSANPSADNKGKRKKETQLTRLGTYCFDPKAKRKPNQIFDLKPRFNLDGQMGDVPNVGWIDRPKTTNPENYTKQLVDYLNTNTSPRIIARPAKRNKRTGQLSVKALGPSIGGTLGNIGQVAARAAGIVIGADGRMRCPPGVPAANQFTDEIGSNCFDFTPAIGRAVLQIVQNLNQKLIQDSRMIDAAVPRIGGRSGGMMTASPEAIQRVSRGLASSTSSYIAGPTGELLGPDGRRIIKPPPPPSPDFERDVAEIRATLKTITPDMYEAEFGRMIREAYPELSEAEITRLVKQAVQRQQLLDKNNAEVRDVLEYAKELGVTIDPNDAESVQRGLAKLLYLMKKPENGAWDLNLTKYFGQDFEKNFDRGILEHQEFQLDMIATLLTTEPEHFGLTQSEFKNLIDSKYGGNVENFKNDLMDVLTGNKSTTEVFEEGSQEAKLVVSALKKFDALRKMEAGNLIGLINHRRKYPELMSNLTGIELITPFRGNEEDDTDAICFIDKMDGGFYVALNPLKVLMNNNFDSKSEDFTLFEPANSLGTEVAKLQAITSSVDRAGAEMARQAYLSELMNLDDLEQRIEQGDEFLQRYIQKSMGEIGQAMYVITHELAHGRQMMLIQNFLKSIPGLADSMTNEELMELAEGLLSGEKKFSSIFGRDWDYASIISNPDWLLTALNDLPEVMQVLLKKKAGGAYAMNKYYEAVFLTPFFSETIREPNDLYAPLMKLRSDIERMVPGSVERRQATRVYENMRKVYEIGTVEEWQKQKRALNLSTALTIAEMQAELYAAVDSGLVKATPEIEKFLAPLNFGKDISPDFGKMNPFAQPVVRFSRDSIKESIKKKLSLTRQRETRKARKMIDAGPDRLLGSEASPLDNFGLDQTVNADYSSAVSKMKKALEGLKSRSQVSRINNIIKQSVMDDATSQQKQILEGNWRGSIWNSSDPTDWGRALQLQPDNVVNAVEQQFIPFMDLIDSSELPTDIVAEINLPPNSLDAFRGEQGTKISVNKHFTAVVHSAEDVTPNQISPQSTQRVMILVPEGSVGLPDDTPGTQKGEVGALILPPGEIEIIGNTKDGVVIGQVVSQKNIERQLNEIRQTLHSLGSNESLSLRQRIIAKRAENRIQRRQELIRRPPAQAAVAMEMDSRKSRLAEKIEYDPQMQTLKVSYRNGHKREFENVPYGKVRDAGMSDKPDDLIIELEKIPSTFNPEKPAPRSRGLASSSVDEFNNEQRSRLASQRTMDILARAKDIGVDIDRHEKEIQPQVLKSHLRNRVPQSRSSIKLIDLNNEQKNWIKSNAQSGEMSDIEILRGVYGEKINNDFSTKLSIAREIAEARGDKDLVKEIDDFVEEISKMDEKQFLEAYEQAANQITEPFDKSPVVLVRDPLMIVDRGRYLTTHQGTRTMGGTNPTDSQSVRETRMIVESSLLGFNTDTDSGAQELRPSSALVMSPHFTEDRIAEIKKIYGDDIKLQHNYSTVGKNGQLSATTGTDRNEKSIINAYGQHSIILRPEVADRTLVVSGDSIGDMAFSGSNNPDILNPAGRLSSINNNGKISSMFFDPASVLFTAKTGKKNTLASIGQNTERKYAEGLTLGSFENPDIQAIVGTPDVLRGDSIEIGKTNMLGTRSGSGLTAFIGAARTRDKLLTEHGIDVVVQSNFFNLNEVEPFNPRMTKKWVEKQISEEKFKNVVLEDLIGSEKTTPYEAFLRYSKLDVERGGDAPIFDHPDNVWGDDAASNAKNRANFISVVDEELARISTGDPIVDEKPRRGLASTTKADDGIEAQKSRASKAKSRLDALQKAYDHYKKTGEWLGADFGVTMSLKNEYRNGDLDVFDGGKPTNLTKVQLDKIEADEKISIEKEILNKIDKSKKELTLQNFLLNEAEKQKEQGIIRFEDIPEDELKTLLEEGRSLTAEDFKIGNEQRAAIHVGASVLDGGELDPGKTDGRLYDAQGNSNFGQSGNTGALNQRQLEMAREGRREKLDELESRKQILEQLKNPGKKITPKTQWEADHLNEKFGLRSQNSKKKFEVGVEYDLNADWVTDEGYSRVVASIEKYIPQAQAEIDADAELFAKLDESADMGFLSAYPASEGLTTRGYWARNSHKAIPEDVATPLTEWEAQQQVNDGRRRFLKIKDDDMLQRWENNIRGSGYLVIGDKSTITSRFGPTGELQLIGKNKPIFGFSATRNIKDHSTVQLVGSALFARAIRLSKEGREVNPESVMSARRGQPLPKLPQSRGRGLASSTSSFENSASAGRSISEKIEQGPAVLPNGRSFDGTPKQLSLIEAETKFGDTVSKINKYFKDKYGVDVSFNVSALKTKNDFTGRREAMYGFLQSIEDVLDNIPGLQQMIEKDKISFNVNQDSMPTTEATGLFQPLNKWFTRTKLGKNGARAEISINLERFRDNALWDISTMQEWTPSLINDIQSNTYLWFGGTVIPKGFQMRLPDDVPETQKEELNAVYRQVTQRMAYAVGVHEIAHYLDFVSREESDASFPSKISAALGMVTGKKPRGEEGDDESIYGSTSNPNVLEKIRAADSVTEYGGLLPQEKLAEAFTAWFLFSGSEYTSKPLNELGSYASNADQKEKYKKAIEQTITPLLEKLGPRVKSAKQNSEQDNSEIRTNKIPPAALLYGLLPYIDVLNKNKSRSAKINRRLARRNASSKETNKENAYS